MRISDWSSDVCSSDLAGNPVPFGVIQALGHVAADVAGRDRQTVELAHRVVLDPLHPVAQTADRRVVRERRIEVGWGRLDTEDRSEELSVGKECVRQCRYRWSPLH